MYPVKVAIVGNGARHVQSKERYREQAERYAELLNQMMTKEHGKEVRRFEAWVVSSAEEALSGDLKVLNYNRVLIFISNRFMRQAKELAKKYAGSIRVVLITGLPPDDEPLIICKAVTPVPVLADMID